MSTTTPDSLHRDTLNGCWILDPTRGSCSMRSYLETMGVDELAIQANEKGESEHDTHHTIELSQHQLKIIKRSRVNNDLVVELTLGQEHIVHLPPGDREKKSLATSHNQQHVQIESSLLTVNGLARVVEVKRLLLEETQSVLQQELTITNVSSGKSHTTVRFFVPYLKVPPHLEDAIMADEATSAANVAAVAAAGIKKR